MGVIAGHYGTLLPYLLNDLFAECHLDLLQFLCLVLSTRSDFDPFGQGGRGLPFTEVTSGPVFALWYCPGTGAISLLLPIRLAGTTIIPMKMWCAA